MSQTHSSKLEARVFQLELAAFLKVCEAVNTPRAVACYMLATNAMWEEYLDLEPPDQDSPTFADDYLVSEAMRKNPLLPLQVDRLATATEKWWEAEALCARTNELLLRYQEGLISFSPATETLITKTQRIIADILGPLTRSKLEFCEAKFRFGPGATSSCSGEDVVPSRKMTSIMDVTTSLLPYYRVLRPRGWLQVVNQDIRLVEGNRVTFVPKSALTDRAIAIEPHGNIFVQLGVGALIRKQLLRQGLDLDRSWEENRRRASVAHKTGDVTIDLSSASDTVAFKLVELLLPVDWFQLLCVCRSEKSQIGDQWVELEKFSSMGNGFTFELETLIFWALARACGDENAIVFGDDIITQRRNATLLLPLLNTLGFKVNERKTCLAGRFFESCGADFHDGLNVRPFYFKGSYADYQSAVIRVGNKIRLYAHRRGASLYCDLRFLDAWLFAANSDASAARTAIPLGTGDSGLIKNFDEACPSKARHGFSGYYTSVWRTPPIQSRRTTVKGAYLTALAWGTPMTRSITERSSPFLGRENESVRGRCRRGSLKLQYVMYWADVGPWL